MCKKCDDIITCAASGYQTFRCNIFVGVRIIKEMPGSVASGTHCIRRVQIFLVNIIGVPVEI